MNVKHDRIKMTRFSRLSIEIPLSFGYGNRREMRKIYRKYAPLFKTRNLAIRLLNK